MMNGKVRILVFKVINQFFLYLIVILTHLNYYSYFNISKRILK